MWASWQKVLHAGDVSGKIMTLIALPSAVFAVVVFFNEIGDILTAPDVRVEVESVGLRCGPAIDARAIPDTRPNAFMIAQCKEANLSAWVKLDLENEDTINRTLAGIALRVTFPDAFGLAEGPVTWTDTRLVNHILENDVQTSQRWPWRAMLLAPGQQIPLEFDFRAFHADDQIAFTSFLNLIEAVSSPLEDSRIPVEILGRFSGTEGWQVLGRCEIDIPKSSIERKREQAVIRGITRRCV